MDNQSVIRIIKNPQIHNRTKHIDIKLFLIREACKSKAVSIEYVLKNEEIADLFTKPLSRDKFIEISINWTYVKCEYKM